MDGNLRICYGVGHTNYKHSDHVKTQKYEEEEEIPKYLWYDAR